MSGRTTVKIAAALAVLVALAATVTTQPVPIVKADPCGMVPPLYAGKTPQIERTGLKKTYVFYKNGIETFAIKPGFKGKLSEFGMLVPVPSTPSIKKIADKTFEHLDAAIDPPEIEVWVGPDRRWAEDAAGPTSAVGLGGGGGGGLAYRDRVNVIKQEAVGMYTVVVLEAGSSKALKKWMDENGYRFPDGMEGTCEEYIGQGWQFVAVKAKVGAKPGVDAAPGKTGTDENLPEQAEWDGLGQGMAFRFKTPKLVVPMRLSTFNAGDTHNVVYMLTDKPVQIENIPKEFVVRQVSGQDLYLNLTQPLPLRLMGGTEKDLTPEHIASVAHKRDPAPHNGIARELFCADLVAARLANTTLEFEEREKDYLNISHELGLDGEEIDTLHRQAAKVERGQEYDAALVDLLDMTLTVIDGMFDKDVLRRDNLNFASYEMPAARNTPANYHAPTHGVGRAYQEGIRWVDTAQRAAALDVAKMLKGLPVGERKAEIAAAEKRGENIFVPPASSIEPTGMPWWVWAISAGGLVLVLLVLLRIRGKRKVGGAAVVIAALGLLAVPAGENAQAAAPAAATIRDESPITKPEASIEPEIAALIKDLSDRTKAEKAVESLVKLGEKSVAGLLKEAFYGSDFVVQGWSIVALSRIGGKDVDGQLHTMHQDYNYNKLVRAWAAAARISMATDKKELLKFTPICSEIPALAKPLAKKLAQVSGADSVEALLKLAQDNPSLAQQIGEIISSRGAEELAKVMVSAKDMEVRMLAAQYLGGQPDAASATINIYAFTLDTDKAPWDGGPLYVPGINWTKEDGEKLVTNLLKWGVWCERASKKAEIQQITNNLNSIQLARNVGYEMNRRGSDMAGWLKIWGKAKGKAAVEEILKANKAETDDRYKGVLDGLK
ncbi:hypothetical protein PLCT2_02848 [Planctomycetaceae bacterium]|nr:hypothetical protein PLCT2_02848 [Planctomycetaceae bacterium]